MAPSKKRRNKDDEKDVVKDEKKPLTQQALSSKELHVNFERFKRILGMPMSTTGKKVVMNFGTDVRQATWLN